MHFSRILITLSSLLGIGTVYLPWKSETMLNVTTNANGFQTSIALASMQAGDAWVVIAGFGLVVLLAITGRRKLPMSSGKKITAALLALVVAGMLVYDSLQMEKLSVAIPGSLLSTKVAANSGVYICLAVAVFTAVIAFSGKREKKV